MGMPLVCFISKTWPFIIDIWRFYSTEKTFNLIRFEKKKLGAILRYTLKNYFYGFFNNYSQEKTNFRVDKSRRKEEAVNEHGKTDEKETIEDDLGEDKKEDGNSVYGLWNSGEKSFFR